MEMHLVVVKAFDGFSRGDVITDSTRITIILGGAHARNVVRVAARTPGRGLKAMPIVQQGSINTTALVVPDLYVQIVPPQNLVLNGVPTNVVGVVGTASWGPVAQPVIVSTMADYAQAFGPIVARKYDMGTQIATAVQQGAQNFRCVRVNRWHRYGRASGRSWNNRHLYGSLQRFAGQSGQPNATARLRGKHLAIDSGAARTAT